MCNLDPVKTSGIGLHLTDIIVYYYKVRYSYMYLTLNDIAHVLTTTFTTSFDTTTTDSIMKVLLYLRKRICFFNTVEAKVF